MSRSQREPALHANHRERLRKTAVQGGLQAMEDHNLLELLLFNSIPRQDTNETAHRLLRSFGGIEGVLKAKKEEIVLCENVGQNTAAFLNALSAACVRYLKDRESLSKGFSTVDEARDRLYEYIKNETEPVMALLALDGMKRINTMKAHKTDGLDCNGLVSLAVRDILSEHSVYAFVAFTHPSGLLAPDKRELQFICGIRDILNHRGVKLTEVMIASSEGFRCLSETGILVNGFFEGQSRP